MFYKQQQKKNFFFQFFQNRFPNDAGPFEAAASKTP